MSYAYLRDGRRASATQAGVTKRAYDANDKELIAGADTSSDNANRANATNPATRPASYGIRTSALLGQPRIRPRSQISTMLPAATRKTATIVQRQPGRGSGSGSRPPPLERSRERASACSGLPTSVGTGWPLSPNPTTAVYDPMMVRAPS